ncbi:hypothetical protein GCM10009347_20200 [Shewanella algicola]|uniref:Uncharacterized protein n=1 Tax=Shewanella algicola TaxID=640633 RepID=A0A9X2CAH4_9GAMM|nr:hypothetical protein [Shewanella algicola]MCL1105955.1 hypothetical protein [Shewanella algicola]GGP53329.1 hypothetical protein GCM10009347_20200 [Shewanella algicola]
MMSKQQAASSISISRIDTDIGTFRVNAKAKTTKILSITSIDILSTDGWEALIIDVDVPWYSTVLKACERHIQQQQ